MRLLSLLLLFIPAITVADDLPFRTQEIDRTLKVGYSVIIADVNNDKKPDIVVADAQRVIWFENPTWKLHTIIAGHTKPDNVSIAAHDIDGDGLVDFALAADWKPFNTKSGGTLQWLKRGKTLDEPWTVYPIAEDIPTIHRIRFANVSEKHQRPFLIVAPLMGKGTTAANNWMERPVNIMSYHVPKEPITERWMPEVMEGSLHVVHNFDVVHSTYKSTRHGNVELLCASYEGVTRSGFREELISAGDQSHPEKNRGASEVRQGRLKANQPIIATIEPWHGNQVVLYEPVDEKLPKKWNRTVIDKDLKWGHALAWADLDGDGTQELIVGVRDTLNKDNPCGVRLYRQQPDKTWKRQLLDPSGVAVEDLTIADLNNDGKPDIIAVGRATGNVRIYWNK